MLCHIVMFLCASRFMSVCGPAFSQLTLEDVDSVSESGNAVPRRDVHPRLPMSYSSWLTQFNTNPYGPSNVGHMPSNVGHIPQSPRQPSDAIYAPPPPYNVVTAGGAKIVVPSGCGSFSAACRSIKDPVTGRSRSGRCFCLFDISFFSGISRGPCSNRHYVGHVKLWMMMITVSVRFFGDLLGTSGSPR